MATTKLMTAEEAWPEIYNHAIKIADVTTKLINEVALKKLKNSTCSYPAQCLLEMVLKELESRV